MLLGSREPALSEAIADREAQDETRTRDPFLTMEVLYQLSYLGRVQRKLKASPDPTLARCRLT
jgi:hypothetical protein